ncbi:hypothetical protein NUU61_004730 [Penicillium alfredii]|uniref:Wilms tumor protein homolog n=1 Tax=Penicillium alfredii TaxID=1506179 RepID=A0A9W9F8C9_9EURO|nr:uncharacterized protein NUU61_004730 [Penicillium alfredii]KAJ5095374.1 hypothetical protein NUU61_004730 [Penicillium alfredii]
MISAATNSLGHGHRRQISTPAPFEAAPTVMANIPQPRGHRRGQTVDFASLSPQMTAARRNTPTTVSQLRDFFNEKSGHSRHSNAAQQYPSYSNQVDRPFTSDLPTQQAYSFQSAASMGSFNQEQLQAINVQAGDMSSPTSSIATALSRSSSQDSDTAALKQALYRMQQEQGQRNPQVFANQSQHPVDTVDWELFPQNHMSAIQKQHASGYTRSMHPLSVQPESRSDKAQTHNSTSCKSTIPVTQVACALTNSLDNSSLITPDATPMKRSIDYSMFSNEHTPTKSHSFSIPRTPVTVDMQRTNSLQEVPNVSPVNLKHQIPSPSNSSSAYFTELAAMPSAGSYGVSPQKINYPATPSTGKRQKKTVSPVSSPIKPNIETQAEPADNDDLDARVKASVQETGVSPEEIAKYISGPHADGTWVCLYEKCNTPFGRKENIKSHIQTHLGDRPYKCDVCDKRFVRGHDLKRHLKTHSGKKPFACACNSSFARQDALTRHRQRDMCVGGFTGVVPKTTKRGRPPKKNRPNMEARQTKANRTRQLVAEKIASETPITTEDPFQEAPVFTSPNYAPSTYAPSNYAPSTTLSFTPPTSPGCSIDNPASPNQAYTSLTPQFEDDMLPMPSPQMADSRDERALAQFEPNMVPECYTHEGLYSDQALSPHDMSSPHTAPTLAESSVGSEIDFFMSQDSTEELHDPFGPLTNQGMPFLPGNYQYVDTSEFETPSSFYPEKSFPSLPPLGEDPLADPIDTLSNEFLIDP